MPSRCIFFFSTLRAWSTLLSRTRTCTRCPLRSRVDGPGGGRTDGQVARATGVQICRMRVPHPCTNQRRFLKRACRWHQGYLSEEAKTSARRRFLGSSRTSRYLPFLGGGAGGKEQ